MCVSTLVDFPLYPGIIGDCGEVQAARGVRGNKTDGEATEPLAFKLDCMVRRQNI